MAIFETMTGLSSWSTTTIIRNPQLFSVMGVTTYAKKNGTRYKKSKDKKNFKEIWTIATRTCGIQENWSGDPTISCFWAILTFPSIFGVKLAWKKHSPITKITSYLHIAITSKRIKLQSRGCTQIVENSKLVPNLV